MFLSLTSELFWLNQRFVEYKEYLPYVKKCFMILYVYHQMVLKHKWQVELSSGLADFIFTVSVPLPLQ